MSCENVEGWWPVAADLRGLSIALLWGGWSNEREISHDSALACEAALAQAGFTRVTMLDVADGQTVVRLAAHEFDLAFVAMHGPFGEDGCVQGLLEVLHIPYTFSGVEASAMASDKEVSRWVYEEAGLPVAKGMGARDASEATAARLLANLSLPVFVKPAVNGSSYGITKVKCAEELVGALELALSSCDHAIVEEAIEGVEVTVPVIGGAAPRALPVIEVVSDAEFYDLKAKYEPSELHHVIPARLESEVLERVRSHALRAHEALGCWGASRSDFIVANDGTPFILETNTIPGMTATSLLPDSARRDGIEFPELVTKFVQWALERAGSPAALRP